MLIGFDASRAFVSEATGTENYSLNLLKALAKIDRKNKYRVYLRGSSSFILRRSSGRVVHGSTINFKWPSNFEFKIIRPSRLWTQVGLALETWRSPVDILFVPAHTLPIFRRRMANGKSLKSIVTIHDLGVEYLPGYHQFPQRYYLDFASKYAAKMADAIIAVSKATKHDLIRRYKTSSKKIYVAGEGVDTALFRPMSQPKAGSPLAKKANVESVKRKYKIKGNYVLFVGTVQPRKNLVMLIKAFGLLVNGSSFMVNSSRGKREKTMNHELSTINLVIAGKLGWDYEEILAAPKKYGIEDRVKFLNYVDTADLPSLYSGAVVFAYPSLFEGFGLPILESLACGCRVIASDIPAHREIYEKYKIQNTRYKISSSRDLAEAIILIKSNDTAKWVSFLYQYITQYNKNKIYRSKITNLTTIYDWERSAKLTLEVFEKVFSG